MQPDQHLADDPSADRAERVSLRHHVRLPQDVEPQRRRAAQVCTERADIREIAARQHRRTHRTRDRLSRRQRPRDVPQEIALRERDAVRLRRQSPSAAAGTTVSTASCRAACSAASRRRRSRRTSASRRSAAAHARRRADRSDRSPFRRRIEDEGEERPGRCRRPGSRDTTDAPCCGPCDRPRPGTRPA